MTVTINGTTGVTTPGVSNTGNQTVSGTGTFASTISVGNVTPAATGAGVTFPAAQSASTNANTLDDYEEGTWTPTIAFGGGTVGQTYASIAGTYIKVGAQVTLNARIYFSNKGTSTGSATITLPFTSYNGSTVFSSALLFTDQMAGLSAGYIPSIYCENGATYAALRAIYGNGNSALDNTSFANNSLVVFTFTYFTAY